MVILKGLQNLYRLDQAAQRPMPMRRAPVRRPVAKKPAAKKQPVRPIVRRR